MPPAKHHTQPGALIEENSEFRQVFHQLPERKLMFRANDGGTFTIEEVTDSYATMIGVSRKKLLGVPYFTAFPDVSAKFKKTGVSDLALAFQRVVTTKRPQVQQVFRYDLPDQKQPGSYVERYWRTTHYPVFGTNGDVTHILQVSTDATQEILTNRQLKEIRLHLEEALEFGKVGTWTWDVDNAVIFGDSGFARMLDISAATAQTGITVKEFFTKIHKQDRSRVEKSVERAIVGHTGFDEEYRISTPGKIHWVIARGRVELYEGHMRFPGVIVDITESKDLQAQVELARRQDYLNRQAAQMLQQRNVELQELSRTKDEFVALASHQLRTPATAVKQYLGMVLQGYVGDITPLQQDMLDKAFESNERQIKIINQILNAARVDTGKLVMAMAPLDLKQLVQGIAEEMRPTVENKAHELIVRLPKKPVPVQADVGYLRMTIENIVNNANAYTPSGGTITIWLRAEKGQAKLSVQDTGVGIKKADLSKLFVKFSRIHNTLSVQAGGTGIGLYLAAEIVRLHSGTIGVSSRIHRGTTFTIELPLTT